MSPEPKADATLQAVLRVTAILKRVGIKTAIIGAWALAHHGYERATEDVDLATAVDAFLGLREIRDALVADGFSVEINHPDQEDPLGGLLNIRAEGIDLIQIVNYDNPWRPGSATLASDAIETAEEGQSGLFYVDLPHLIALKLCALSRGTASKVLPDVHELLQRHPEADRAALGVFCERFGLKEEWGAVSRWSEAAWDQGTWS